MEMMGCKGWKVRIRIISWSPRALFVSEVVAEPLRLVVGMVHGSPLLASCLLNHRLQKKKQQKSIKSISSASATPENSKHIHRTKQLLIHVIARLPWLIRTRS